MPRLLGRSLSRRNTAVEAAEPTEDTSGRIPSGAESPAPRRPSTRRRRSGATVTTDSSMAGESTEPRGRRRSSPPPARNNGATASQSAAQPAAQHTAQPAAGEQKPSRRRGGRRGSSDSTPDDPMLAAMQRQTDLLERQAQLIETQQLAMTRLTDAMLGARRGGVATHGAQVEVQPRLAIFVDVPNILYAAEATNVELNWGKVASFLSEGRTLVRAIAYAPISDDPNERTENERFVVPFLEHGYRIATKPLKRFRGGSVKANFDVELAIDVLTMADRVDVIVLVSGDGDFRRLVEIVGSRGVRVEVMAFGQSTSQDLRVVADRYIDIAGYIPELSGRA